MTGRGQGYCVRCKREITPGQSSVGAGTGAGDGSDGHFRHYPACPTKHPMQPIELDTKGVPRFKANVIVEWLRDTGRINLNEIVKQGFPTDDVSQFWQLLGYSTGGYGELDFVDPKIVEAADIEANRLLSNRKSK